MTLTEFLLARIAEDEAAAIEAAREWTQPIPAQTGVLILGHIAQTPARVLAECEAKRQIVEEFGSGTWVLGDGTEHVPRVARLLATAYADHSDYRDEWKL